MPQTAPGRANDACRTGPTPSQTTFQPRAFRGTLGTKAHGLPSGSPRLRHLFHQGNQFFPRGNAQFEIYVMAVVFGSPLGDSEAYRNLSEGIPSRKAFEHPALAIGKGGTVSELLHGAIGCKRGRTCGALLPSSPSGTGLTIPARTVADSFIFVNRNGQRFMNEESSLQHTKMDSILRYNYFEGGLRTDMTTTGYPNAPAFMVFDQTMMEAGPVADVDGAGMGWVIHGLYTWSADNQAELEKGWIAQADTLEELAEKVSGTDMWGNEVHIDPAGLTATVEAFNAACEAGEDADFGRSFLAPIGEGPYYAFEIVPATLYTTGGAAHDVNAQAVDWLDRPIPRLYMAGLMGDPFTVHAHGISGAVSWARIAAEQIAQLEPWA